MIKIRPFYEHKNRDEIVNLYLNLIAAVTPFYPEDIFPEGRFKWRGEWHDVKKFRDITSRHCRNRTKEYCGVLKKYGIGEGGRESDETLFKNDALLAKKIIQKKSDLLYQYLYEKVDIRSAHVNAANLYMLLTTPMNKLQIGGHNLDFKVKDSEKELLSHVFRYNAFASKKEVSDLLSLLGVEVCPYCNRIFITTLAKDRIRAQIDHYKSKSEYPQFALSIMNMVPSCGQCNQIKGDYSEAVLYPYVDEMGDSWIFKTQPCGSIMYLTGNRSEKDNFILIGKEQEKCEDKEYRERLRNSLKVFKLETLYNTHREYVLDLYQQRYVFGDDYLESLCDRFPELFHNITDVKNMLYLSDIRKESWGNRPLSKLTHDIDAEISGLKIEHKDKLS